MEMVELTVCMDQIRFDALSFYMGSRENTEPQKALEKMLEELYEVLGMPLESEEYDTLNGLIFHQLGTSPEVDSHVELEGLQISVTKIHNYQVETALIRKVPVTAEEPVDEK